MEIELPVDDPFRDDEADPFDEPFDQRSGHRTQGP